MVFFCTALIFFSCDLNPPGTNNMKDDPRQAALLLKRMFIPYGGYGYLYYDENSIQEEDGEELPPDEQWILIDTDGSNFDPLYRKYKLYLPENTQSTVIIAEPKTETSQVSYTYSGSTSPKGIFPNITAMDAITVTVNAKNGDTDEYTIELTRNGSNLPLSQAAPPPGGQEFPGYSGSADGIIPGRPHGTN